MLKLFSFSPAADWLLGSRSVGHGALMLSHTSLRLLALSLALPLLVLVALQLYQTRRARRREGGVPSPGALPLIGHTVAMAQNYNRFGFDSCLAPPPTLQVVI